MKKLLSTTKANTVLDLVLDEHKYYFRGDRVRGQLIVVPAKPLKITGIQLQLIGRIRTYINSKKQDEYIYFKQPLSLDVTPGILQQEQTYTFTFNFTLPVDVSLPSCTESDTNNGGIIEYIIEGSLVRSTKEWSTLTTSLHIPVLERLDISKSEMLEPVWDKIIWRSKQPDDFIDEDDYYGVDEVTLSASLNHRGYIRNQKINVTVDIQHFQPFQRENGLTISLIRCTRILCKEKAYLLAPIVVNSKKVDINIQRTSGQTITTSLLIPKYITPTINLNARLMQIDYRIEVKAELDEYQPYPSAMFNHYHHHQKSGVNLACMKVELPIVIGTLPNIYTPPDTLDPKFVKGIHHVTQINEPKPQPAKPSHRSIRPASLSSSLDLLNLTLPKSPFSRYHHHRYTALKRNSNPLFPSTNHQSQISLPPSVPPHLENTEKKIYYKTIKTINESDEEEKDDDDYEKDLEELIRSKSPDIDLPLSLGETFNVLSNDSNISRTTTYTSISQPKSSIMTSTVNESNYNESIAQSELANAPSSFSSQCSSVNQSHQNQHLPTVSSSSIRITNRYNKNDKDDGDHNNNNERNSNDSQVHTEIAITTTTVQQNNYHLMTFFQDDKDDNNDESTKKDNDNEHTFKQTTPIFSSSHHSLSFNKQNMTPPLSPNQCSVDSHINTNTLIHDDDDGDKSDPSIIENNSNRLILKKVEKKMVDQQDNNSLSSKKSVDAGQQQQNNNNNHNNNNHSSKEKVPKDSSIGICRQVSVFSNYRQTNLSPLPSPSENKKMILKEDEEEEKESVDNIYKPESTIDNLGIQGTYREPILPPPTNVSIKSDSLNSSNNDHERLILVNSNNNNESKEDTDHHHHNDTMRMDHIFEKPHEIPIDDDDMDSDMYSDSDDEDFVTILARREKEIQK